MSQNVSVCDIDSTLKDDLRKFRFRKATNNAAIIMKVDREKQLIFKEEELEDIDVDELREALPEHQPRFLVYSFKLDHGDGRISYPMCFIFSSPQDSKTELQMMYAGSKLELVKVAELTKVFEIRELEELTEEWLHSKLLK
ncbi:glia maturation factor beta-like [Daphnia pulex]|uniref:glia maturation factor beta-like n=1 Tax=Daphnia pulex TaxID=6669 RepID=UPI001EE05D14|nr:glia maturation factor beta-like [Daphnia pulex]